jgi:SAM-dependent methyltransferase
MSRFRLGPAISFDRVAEIYESSRGRPAETSRRVAELLRTRFGFDKILDVGVGTGRLIAPCFANPPVELVGVDVSAIMLKHAVRKGLRAAVRADARSLPFKDGAIDRTISTHLLHLAAEWQLVLEEISRVTRLEYLSVLESESGAPNLQQEYLAIAEQAGCNVDSPGITERELAKLLKPNEILPIPPEEYQFDADSKIIELESRAFHRQWMVPDEVHNAIIEELRRSYGGKVVTAQLNLSLVAWEIPRIREFVRGSRVAANPDLALGD